MKYVPRRFDVFDDIMDGMFASPFYPARKDMAMKTDIQEKDGMYMLDIELPGFRKEDISISLKDGNLTVSAHRKSEQNETDEEGHIIRQERFRGECSRSFYVGEGIREEDVKAKFENGELKITVPSNTNRQVEEKKWIAIE